MSIRRSSISLLPLLAAREGAKNLTLTILNAEQDKTVAQVIQANLADIGINLRIQTQDNATFNAIPGGGGGGPHRQLVYTLFTTQPDPSWSTVWFTCAQVKQWNWGEWCSPLYERPNNAALRDVGPSAPHAAVHPGAEGVGQGSQHGLDLEPDAHVLREEVDQALPATRRHRSVLGLPLRMTL